jgi:hypothetical protein
MAALALGSMGWGLTPAAAARGGAPLLAGLDGYTHAVETRHPLAARYFNQAMMLVYGFNPEEAMRSFEAAVALDPRFASAWWGLAWAIGPNINTDLNHGTSRACCRPCSRRAAMPAAPARSCAT